MPRPKKKPTSRIEKGLTPQEQHELYELLNKEHYHVGMTWLARKGIDLSMCQLSKWYTRYASEFAFVQYRDVTDGIAAELRSLGEALTDQNIKNAAAKLFERRAILRLDEDRFMRWRIEDRRLAIQEEAIKLDKAKFKRLEKIEEDSRKALSAGGTEAELIAEWKRILNFDENS